MSYDTKLQHQCKKLTYNKCEVLQHTELKLTSLPAYLIPIDIHRSTFFCSSINYYSTRKQPIFSSFKEYLETIPRYKQLLLIYTVIDYPEYFIAHIESRETILVSSDGGKRINATSGAFVIANKRCKLLPITHILHWATL